MLRSVCTPSCPIPRHEPQPCLFTEQIPHVLVPFPHSFYPENKCFPFRLLPHFLSPHMPSLQLGLPWTVLSGRLVFCSLVLNLWADSGYVQWDERGSLLWGRNLRLCVLSMCRNPDDRTLASQDLTSE